MLLANPDKTLLESPRIFVLESFNEKEMPVPAQVDSQQFSQVSYFHLVSPNTLKLNLYINLIPDKKLKFFRRSKMKKGIRRLHPFVRADFYAVKSKAFWHFFAVRSKKSIRKEKVPRSELVSLGRSIHDSLGYNAVVIGIKNENQILVRTPDVHLEQSQQGLVYFPSKKIVLKDRKVQAVIELVKQDKTKSLFKVLRNGGKKLRIGQKILFEFADPKG